MKSLLLILAVTFSATQSSLSQNKNKNQAKSLQGADLALMNDHDPASELANFKLLPGYEVNLFASDPMLANPVHMHWDSKGRLWVACSWSYPQIKPGDVANDKIIILEDTDGDGAADKSTVFADGLYLPTGIELANGGCYVGQSPDIFFLKDTNGDDIADVKELILTGFGIEDSHHSISAWRRGPGGWLYFQEGLFLNTQVETQYGLVRNFNGGVYQLNPRTQELRLFCLGTAGNPWGHVFDRWGQSFMVNNPRIMYLSPASGNSGEATPIKPLAGTEKQCGGDLATGTHVGDDLRGQLLTGRFKSRSVVRYEFIEKGAGFSANILPPLITSKHPNFRPVDVKTGPDGAIYVADWYNSIINHAHHDFRDPRRDHEHGRIWRITHKERPLVEKPQLDGLPIPALIEHLKSPQTWTRHQARKELSERDPLAVITALEAWVLALNPELPDYDHHLVEAMWACQNVEQVSEAILTKVVNANDGHARSAAARILRYWHPKLSDPLAIIAQLAGDEFPRTRMEAVLSAGFIPQAEAYPAALHAIDLPTDNEIRSALTQTTQALASYYLPAMEKGELIFAKPSHKDYAEKGTDIGFEERFAQFLNNSAPSKEEIKEVKEQLLTRSSNKETTQLVNALVSPKVRSKQATAAMLAVLASKASEVKSKSKSKVLQRQLPRLESLLDHEDNLIAELAAETLGAWHVSQAAPRLIALLEDSEQRVALRQSAALGLGSLASAQSTEKLSLDALTRLTNSEHDPVTRYLALQGLLRANLTEGVAVLATLFSADLANADPLPALQTVQKNRKAVTALARALQSAQPHPTVVTRVSEFHRNTGLLPKALLPFFQEPSRTATTLSATLLAENQEALTADVVNLGDPHRGETIYRRQSLACTSCHAIGPAGPAIGPNLVAVGAAASPSYMVESILKPNAAIAEHYENRLFTLSNGSIQMGVVTFKSDKEVIVRDSAQGGKEISIPASTIKREQAMPSLMPSGLANQLNNRQEFLDLTAFLSVLGRPGDFANNESPLIRKWLVAEGTQNPPPHDAPWTPAYSKVDGTLPPEDLTSTGVIFAKGALDVQVAGKAELQINTVAGLQLWLDDQKVTDLTAPLDLSLGRHSLTFRIDSETRPKNLGLRVEVKTPSSSALKFTPESGP